MKHRFVYATMIATVMSLCTTVSLATDDQADEEAATKAKVKVDPKKVEKQKKEIAAKRKAYAKTKFTDINSASKEELKKLPGIDDAAADRVIAGRPYGSKAWLMTQKIIPDGTFQSIKDRIVAVQPVKTAAEIEAAYGKKK